MASNTSIEWAHHSFNPWHGCVKVSPGCQHCYAEALDHRFYGGQHWGVNAPRQPASKTMWAMPRKWDRAAASLQQRHRVFCGSMCDVFEDNPQVSRWRDELFLTVAATPNLDWLLLTKRPENIRRFYPGDWLYNDRQENVWLGVSVEAAAYTSRIDHLRNTNARVKFLSLEPLLGPLPDLDLSGIDWVIVGGESGPGARPMQAHWVRPIRDQCIASGIPFFFKQWGGVRKKRAGRELDGEVWNEFPVYKTNGKGE